MASSSRWLSLLLVLPSLAQAASTAIATNPILTTITTTSTRFSTRTIGTSTSTTTPILCDDGTCIAISLIDVPILETSTILGVGTVVSTVGFTTIFSDIPDGVSTAPPDTPATPTATPNTPPAGETTAPPSAVATSLLTTTQTSGSASGQVSVLTIFASASAGASTADANHESASNASGGGLEAKYVAVIAVLAVVIGLAVIGVLVFLFLRRRRANAQAVPLGSSSGDDATGTALGAAELENKPVSGGEIAELGTGYRGTAAPAPWSAGDASELPAGAGAYRHEKGHLHEMESPGGHYKNKGSVYEMDASVRHELR